MYAASAGGDDEEELIQDFTSPEIDPRSHCPSIFTIAKQFHSAQASLLSTLQSFTLR